MNKEYLTTIIALRHELHRNPELSLAEIQTAKRIRDFLERNTSLKIEERDGWFYAVKEGTNPDSAALAFRADMDALPIDETDLSLAYASACPGVSHKCGHDGHCAALCALALELDALTVKRSVYLIFQGAEEIGEGAKKASSLIREKNIHEVYAFHNLSGYPEGEIVYKNGLTQPASEGIAICFHGKTSHASAPEDGSNPAGVMAKTVLHAQELVNEPRQKMMLCTVVGIHAGNSDFGISPGDGRIMMTLRAEEEREMKALEKQIFDYAKEEAEKAGMHTEFSVSDYFPETRNSVEGIRNVLTAAGSLGIPAREMKTLWRASEDFGYYLKEASGAMFYIGNGENWPALHTKEYDFNDRILETAADLFMALVRSRAGVRTSKDMV